MRIIMERLVPLSPLCDERRRPEGTPRGGSVTKKFSKTFLPRRASKRPLRRVMLVLSIIFMG
jgi:hypothetical protein